MKAATPLEWKVAFYLFGGIFTILLIIWFVRTVLSDTTNLIPAQDVESVDSN